jgi:RimJ/RimL family protein N-acetyltransferase
MFNKLDLETVDLAIKCGFNYEGIFRNYGVIKGRNRDAAWFSITDEEF